MTDLDWATFRAHQSFPLADLATGKSLQQVQLPQSFLLDICILVPSMQNLNISGKFYIALLRDLNLSFLLVISYLPENINEGIPVAIALGIAKNFTLMSSISLRTVRLAPLLQDQLILQRYPWINVLTGTVCAGITSTYIGGSLSFDITGTKLHNQCIQYVGGDHLLAIKFGNHYMTGIITLLAGLGILFLNIGDNTIKISVSLDYIKDISQGSISNYLVNELGSIGTPIKTINGVAPDSDGNIQISPVDCILINEIGHGITINNPCARPCCTGDTSLSGISASIDVLKLEQKILRLYYINMSTVVNYMQANLSTLMAKG